MLSSQCVPSSLWPQSAFIGKWPEKHSLYDNSFSSLAHDGTERIKNRPVSGDAGVDVIALNPSSGGGGNEILGAGSDCSGAAASKPIFFTALHGLVTVAGAAGGAEPANQSSVYPDDTPVTGGRGSRALAAAATAAPNSRLADSLNLSVSAAGLEDLTMSESKGDQLKAAFLLFCKRNMGQSVSIVAELFPAATSAGGASATVDSSLDRLVASMSQALFSLGLPQTNF